MAITLPATTALPALPSLPSPPLATQRSDSPAPPSTRMTRSSEPRCLCVRASMYAGLRPMGIGVALCPSGSTPQCGDLVATDGAVKMHRSWTAGPVRPRAPTGIDASPARDADRLHHRTRRRDRPSPRARTGCRGVPGQALQRDGAARGAPCRTTRALSDALRPCTLGESHACKEVISYVARYSNRFRG